MSFEHNFDRNEKDETYFCYHLPYTFTRLTRFIRDIKASTNESILRDATPFCQSLSGMDVPYLMVTSRVKMANAHELDKAELPEDEHIPSDGRKKVIVLTGRVHPGESNSSFMMEGFIKFICSNHKVA